MIPHQGKGIKVEGIFALVFGDVSEIGSKIPLIQKNRLFLVPPTDYVVEGTGEINPGSSSHGRNRNQSILYYNCLTPKPC